MRTRGHIAGAALLAFGLATVVGSVHSLAAPEPAKATKTWDLDFEFHDLARISLTLPGDSSPTTFWYLLYTVTNSTGRDVPFYPSFELVTDNLGVITGGDNISPSVYEAVIARHKHAYPFLVGPIEATGKLLQGSDNARTSMAVFREVPADVNSLTVYVAGLSGDVARVPNPSFDGNRPETAENAPFFALRKTLAIRYDLPGDPRTQRSATPIRRSMEWVMR